MKELLEIVTEGLKMPAKIHVQVDASTVSKHPVDQSKTKIVTVETRPEVTWLHCYPISWHDELQWQRRITGTDKTTVEEGNWIYFLHLEGSKWELYGIYNTVEECLYFDLPIRDFEQTAGVNFHVSMSERNPQ